MTHQWDSDAEEIRRRKQQPVTSGEKSAELVRFEKELDALVASVAPEFGAFIVENDEAAQNLLRAHGDKYAAIIFGADRTSGSSYTSVYFGVNGLTHEAGPGLIGGSGPVKSRATPEQAVRYFARFGDGYNYTTKQIDHAKVRDITAWFVGRIQHFRPK